MDGGSTEDAGGGSVAGLGGLERWRAHTKIVAWCLVLFGSVLLNATLLVAFVRRPGLRTISNRFVMNLIASNLLAIFVLTGLLIADSCGPDLLSTSSISLCALSEGATALVTTSSILSVLLIGVDQYLAVVDPLRYRTRIDKLKCGLLILAVWLIALAFGALASLNPQPRGIWSLCSPRQQQQPMEIRIDEEITIPSVNDEAMMMKQLHVETKYYSSFPAAMTYGLVYALVYALLGYLLPFLAVCWIYASIYTAARRNSERTRRNGSRPILSSGSFSEEMSRPENGQHHVSIEDFRRIPKISSLSSIDENSEICPSQVGNQEEESPGAGVIFTLGSSKVEKQQQQQQPDTAQQDDAKDSSKPKVPIAALKAEFLSKEKEESARAQAKSRFPEVPDQRRKSSHDLMYEEMMLGGKHPYEYDVDDELDDSDVDDDDELARNFEEALPLSEPADRPDEACQNQGSQRSISVNFDLAEPAVEQSSRLLVEKLSNGSASSQPTPIVTITPPGQRPGQTLHRVPSVKSTGGYINNLKYRISNGSLFKYREETRAARISALVIVMGLICWTPYVYLLVQRNLPRLGDYTPSGLDATALGFLVLATYVSPLLFGYRSRRVKRELRKFFCFKRELSYKNNRSLMAKKVLRRRHSGATILGQFVGEVDGTPASRYNIFNYVYGRNRWPKEKVQFVQVPETALAVETCRSSFSSGASTQISSTSTDEC